MLKSLLDALTNIQIHAYRLNRHSDRTDARTQNKTEPVELQQWIRETEEKSGRRGNVSPIDLDELYQMAQRWYTAHEQIDYTKKEIVYLPFILGKTRKNEKFFLFLLQCIQKVSDLELGYSKKRRTFKNLVLSYFVNYDNGTISQQIRNIIFYFLDNDERKDEKFSFKNAVLYLKGQENFLQKNGHAFMSENFSKGIHAYLNKIYWPNDLRYCPFVTFAVRSYFLKTQDSLSVQTDVLKEVCDDTSFSDAVPYCSGEMILRVDRENNAALKERLRVYLYQRLGDPRDDENLNWLGVNEKARDIFLNWLKQNDLYLFFSVITKAVRLKGDSVVKRTKMWEERRKFWEGYVDSMYYTRVFLGPAEEMLAKEITHNLTGGYGRLTKTVDSAQSLLMFSIGDYVFIEGTHNMSLRAWKKGEQPLPFFEKKYSYRFYKYSVVVNDWRIIWQIKHTTNWQARADEWIALHCHVKRRK